MGSQHFGIHVRISFLSFGNSYTATFDQTLMRALGYLYKVTVLRGVDFVSRKARPTFPPAIPGLHRFHVCQNAFTDYEWIIEGGGVGVQHPDSTCYTKVTEGGEVTPRSFVVSVCVLSDTLLAVDYCYGLLLRTKLRLYVQHSSFCHECAIEQHGLASICTGELSPTQLDVFSIKTDERGLCCGCEAAICANHMPPNLLHRIGKKEAATKKGWC